VRARLVAALVEEDTVQKVRDILLRRVSHNVVLHARRHVTGVWNGMICVVVARVNETRHLPDRVSHTWSAA
jgi:hypothetical protein